jgi:hypothetical protein
LERLAEEWLVVGALYVEWTLEKQQEALFHDQFMAAPAHENQKQAAMKR